jgi:hypothetical protein
MDLEINPGAPMKVTGKVHSNGNLYRAPPSSLEFAQSVDASGRVYTNRAPYDPTGGSAIVRWGKLTMARVPNGQQLPASGLTVPTDLPLYVKGNFNAPDITPGSTNTTATKPSSLVGDAITVLSANWSDAYGNNALSARTPANTTVNAAFLAGIVQPTNTIGTLHYSGGVENFPRFLEKWSGYTFTYNGSMVVMYPSQFATNYWVQTGTYYNAPSRKWAFDVNFLDYRRLPPATPQVRQLVRGQWQVVAAQ